MYFYDKRHVEGGNTLSEEGFRSWTILTQGDRLNLITFVSRKIHNRKKVISWLHNLLKRKYRIIVLVEVLIKVKNIFFTLIKTIIRLFGLILQLKTQDSFLKLEVLVVNLSLNAYLKVESLSKFHEAHLNEYIY